MERAMTICGIGMRWARWSLLLSLPLLLCAWWFRSSLVADGLPPWVFEGAGAVLLLVGVPFWFMSAVTLKRHYDSRRLCTTGVFAICRNPIYAAWTLFIVPGVLLFFRIPLLLVIPLIMYGALRVLLPREEQWLEATYGDEYREYKRRVNRLLPTIGRAGAPKEQADTSATAKCRPKG
jgi:protein-S-isoprenylcysteine O-methyltransferase Ste14